MIHATIQLLLYALLAGFSALAFAATLAVMQAGRLKTLGFGTGFVLGQVFTCSLFVDPRRRRHGREQANPLGACSPRSRCFSRSSSSRSRCELRRARLRSRRKARASARRRCSSGSAACVSSRRRSPASYSGSAARSACCSPRLPQRRSPPPAFATRERPHWSSGTALLATVLVWAPVIVYVLLGDRAVGIMTRAQQRLARRQPGVKVYALLVLAGVLILDAISLLL